MYDVIVLGLGGMGTAAAAELARRGHRVLGLEQYRPGHDQGSSHGHTRVIRTAYYEHPAYVPLVRRAFRVWHELRQRTGEHLLTDCPCLSIGQAGSELIAGVLRAGTEHSLPIENLNSSELVAPIPAVPIRRIVCRTARTRGRFPLCRAVRAGCHRRCAGAWSDPALGEPVREWQATPAGVSVRTDQDTYRAGRLVIAAGPWARIVLGELGSKLTVMRQTPIWLAPPDPRPFVRSRFPIFLADTPAGIYYGLPAIDPRGVKLAQHYGAPELAGPDDVDRMVTHADELPIRAFVRRHLPAADGPAPMASFACTR